MRAVPEADRALAETRGFSALLCFGPRGPVRSGRTPDRVQESTALGAPQTCNQELIRKRRP